LWEADRIQANPPGACWETLSGSSSGARSRRAVFAPPNYTIFYFGFSYKVDCCLKTVLFGDLRLTFRTKKIIISIVELEKNNPFMR